MTLSCSAAQVLSGHVVFEGVVFIGRAQEKASVWATARDPLIIGTRAAGGRLGDPRVHALFRTRIHDQFPPTGRSMVASPAGNRDLTASPRACASAHNDLFQQFGLGFPACPAGL
jgi:hypothetical protein